MQIKRKLTDFFFIQAIVFNVSLGYAKQHPTTHTITHYRYFSKLFLLNELKTHQQRSTLVIKYENGFIIQKLFHNNRKTYQNLIINL